VEKLIADKGQSGALWLHGSSGTGKTVLAQFIARQSKHDWLLIQLRGCDSASSLEFSLCRMLQALQSGRIGGVILDDFPTKYASSVRLRLSMLANEVLRMNGSIVVTSAKSPSANLQGCFGKNGPNVVNVPYLSSDEVAELVKLAGGDVQKWAGVVHTFCGLGHPQLVQARISGLQQRNWPKGELLAGIPGFGISPKEIEDERDSIRERLLWELPPEARDLLHRLALIVGCFDRELAIAVGEVIPPVNRPGESLDILVGPWVEVLANERFRVSPLVSSAGAKTLSRSRQMEVHKRIVDHLIARQPFPGNLLGTLLGHVLASNHAQGMMWLAMAVTYTRPKDRSAIAEHLFILPLLRNDKPLFEENMHISAMLRLAQFRVAVWAGKTDLLPEIADRLIAEGRMIKDKEISESFLCIAINSILVEPSLRIGPTKWIQLLEEMDQTLSGEGKFARFARTLVPKKVKGLGNGTISQLLFVVRATSLKNIAELADLFSELARLEHKHRETLLSALNVLPSGRQLMISSAWLAEVREGSVRGTEAAEAYGQLADIANAWGNIDIAVECECARAVMLDEYANDSNGALASLDAAEKQYPSHIRLARQRASVYYRRGDHATALTTIARIADVIPKEQHVERAFALREGAISAAKTGDFARAAHFFSEACEAASAATDNMRTMAIGLRGDQAVAEFQLGKKEEALNLILQAVVDAETLEPEAGKNEKYCIRSLGYMILWVQEQVKPNLLSQKDIQIVPGFCSNPEPSDEIMKMASQPFVGHWYQLALLEATMGIDSGIMGELRKRTSTQKILFFELILNRCVMAKYVIKLDTRHFLSYLPEYVSKIAYEKESAPEVIKENLCDLANADLSAIQPADWTSDLHLQIAKDAILALVAAAVCSDVHDIREQLLNHVGQNTGLAIALQGFLDCLGKEMRAGTDGFEVIASHLGYLATLNTDMSPDKLFMVTFRLWEWLPKTVFKDILEDRIANYLTQRWQEIIEHQKFLLRQSWKAVPAIEIAIGESTRGTAKIAKLLLGAEIAVSHKLSAELRSKLQNS
jgi:hypothetical protein